MTVTVDQVQAALANALGKAIEIDEIFGYAVEWCAYENDFYKTAYIPKTGLLLDFRQDGLTYRLYEIGKEHPDNTVDLCVKARVLKYPMVHFE